MMTAFHDFDVIPLHEKWDLLEDCAVLLNLEWKRTIEARIHSLQKSRDAFPVSLVMFSRGCDGKQVVVGHSRLNVIPGKTNALFLESVIVDKKRRGNGIGSVLMSESEKYALRRGFAIMYLTTHDAREFYQKLGYNFCPPITTFSSVGSVATSEKTSGLIALLTKQFESSDPKDEKSSIVRNCRNLTGPPAPPPPPPPLKTSNNATVYFMSKILT